MGTPQPEELIEAPPPNPHGEKKAGKKKDKKRIGATYALSGLFMGAGLFLCIECNVEQRFCYPNPTPSPLATSMFCAATACFRAATEKGD